MEIIYSDQEPTFENPSIFLAGPTYRSGDEVVEGSFWRKSAISLLGVMQFNGTVFVPERNNDIWKEHYLDQVEWEYNCLENCTVIVFWVPRCVRWLPAFTTNCEFGRYVSSARTLYGRPKQSQKNRYLDWLYTKVSGKVPHNEMGILLADAIALSKKLTEIK